MDGTYALASPLETQVGRPQRIYVRTPTNE